MHPLYGRRGWLALYVLVCLLAGVLLAELLRLVVPQPTARAHALVVPLTLVYGFGVLSAWWVCRRHPLLGSPPLRVLGAQAVAAMQASALWSGAATLWGVFLARVSPDVVTRPQIVGSSLFVLCAGLPLYVLSAGAHYLVLTLEASHAATERALQSQVAAREAELRALRAQLNPHFLFNSLNSINALVGSDPEGARRMCEGLGDFLRRTLHLGARDAVTLAEELALVDRYLAIEQVRFGSRLSVERTIDPAALECRMPPLLLQPLVENAIKHGVADRVEGGTVHVRARVAAGRLVLVIENPVDEDAPARPGAGMGLENVRRRLAVLGARETSLEAVRTPQSFVVTVQLAARPAAESEVSRVG